MILPSSLKAGFSWRGFSSVVSGRMPWSVDVGVAVDGEGDDLALEAALLGRLGGELVGAQADLVELGAGDLPLVGDHLGRDALRDEVVALHQLRREGEAVLLHHLVAVGEGDVAHVLDAAEPIATSWTPEATSAAAKLTACWAEPHWRSIVVAGVSIGRPASSQALRPMLIALLAELLHAAGDDVLDLGGVDAGALDQLGVGLGEQVRGVDVLVVALLLVAAPDRGARPPRRSRPRGRRTCRCRSPPSKASVRLSAAPLRACNPR